MAKTLRERITAYLESKNWVLVTRTERRWTLLCPRLTNSGKQVFAYLGENGGWRVGTCITRSQGRFLSSYDLKHFLHLHGF